MASIKHITPQNDEESTLIALIQEFEGTIQEWLDNQLQDLHEEQDEDLRDMIGDFIQMAQREGLEVSAPTIQELLSI